jgi:preprotein translocase subunit SecD
MAARARTSPTRPNKAFNVPSVRKRKAGLSGLFHRASLAAALLVVMAGAVASEPVAIELTSAEPAFDQRNGMPIISFKMTDASKRLFAEFTSKNIGRKMEMRVDGKAIMAAMIREPILGGAGQISDASLTIEKAKDLAERISAGKAKIEFEIVND